MGSGKRVAHFFATLGRHAHVVDAECACKRTQRERSGLGFLIKS